MARGLRKGDGGAHLMTFHPPGGNGSSTWFHNDDWLDFNMRQNGHVAEFTGRYDQTRGRTTTARRSSRCSTASRSTRTTRSRSTPKKLGHSIAADVRRPLYWDLFSGACGHTYGHHSVWQMWQPGRGPINNPLMPWFEAIDQPGAGQMQHGRRLIESRPFLTRVPGRLDHRHRPRADQRAGRGPVPLRRPRATPRAPTRWSTPRSAGRSRCAWTRSRAPKVKAWWFNPRNGKATAIGEFANTGEREFLPPDTGEMLDWVLVLDDAAKNFPLPAHR